VLEYVWSLLISTSGITERLETGGLATGNIFIVGTTGGAWDWHPYIMDEILGEPCRKCDPMLG